MRDEMSPRMAQLVPGDPVSPHECQDLMALDFRSHYFQAFAHVPSYSDWLLEADLSSTYRYERRVLKLLQWGSPPRPWRLKCPSHLLWLDDLHAAFPDARYVMTHRDPAEVMVSVADVYAEVGRQFSEDLDLHHLGRLNVEHWSAAMDRLLAFRAEHGDDAFYDIDFRTMQEEPTETVRGLYRWLGEPVTEPFEAGMRRWWDQYGSEREPNIHPSPEEFGLDLERVRASFAAYTARIPQWTGRAHGTTL